MDQELRDKLTTLEQKIDATLTSAEKTRKYFLWTLIITVVVIVLPLVGIALLLPMLLSSITLPAGL
ncbi:MAG: hypothetical protein KBC26_01185 [Candidatus Pacebacteria bacterium]|nr:hypothetical protein [Candidatus Paceibacterota bacterium]